MGLRVNLSLMNMS